MKVDFEINDSCYLTINSSESDFNLKTYNSIVNISLSVNNDIINIGGYFTLYECFSELECALADILNKGRQLKNEYLTDAFSLTKELNMTYYNFYSKEDLNLLDVADNLLKNVVFNGDYYVGLYSTSKNIIIEIGPRYLNFEDESEPILTKNFNYWLNEMKVMKFELNEVIINNWINKCLAVTSSAGFSE